MLPTALHMSFADELSWACMYNLEVDLARLAQAKLAANLAQPVCASISQFLSQGLAPDFGGPMGLPTPPWGHPLVIQMPNMVPMRDMVSRPVPMVLPPSDSKARQFIAACFCNCSCSE